MKIDMTTVPSHHILSIRDEVPFDGIATFLKPSFERIEAIMRVTGVQELANRSYTYAMSPDGIDIAAAYVIADADLETIRHAAEESNNNDARGAFGGLELIELEESPAALTVHRGSYNKLGETWETFAQELATQGVKVAQPAFEDYVDRGNGNKTAETITNLYWYLVH